MSLTLTIIFHIQEQ